MKWSNFDHAVFYCTDPFSVIFIHVDDMTLVTKTLAVMDQLKGSIKAILEVVDSGGIHWLLGIEIQRSLHTKSIHLSQRSYIDAILSHYGFSDIKSLTIPFDPHIHLTKDQMPTTVKEKCMTKHTEKPLELSNIHQLLLDLISPMQCLFWHTIVQFLWQCPQMYIIEDTEK